MTALERRYRRWVRVYPPGPRRAELVDTLVDCAPPGRRHPAPREVAGLLRHGLRARLGRPGSTAVVVLATLVALVAGLFGAGAAARVGWQWAPALPGGAAATAITDTVFPGLAVLGGGDAPIVVDTSDGEGVQFGYADYWVKHTPATRDVDAFTAGARDRLAAAGWRIHGEIVATASGPDEITPSRSAEFLATRGGLVLSFYATVWGNRAPWDSDGAASFTLSRSAPAWLWSFTVAGALLGALAGWLAVGWASRRAAPGTARAATAGLVAWCGFGLMLAAVTVTMMWSMLPGRPWTESVFTGLFFLTRFPPWALAAVTLLPVAIVAVRRPARSTRRLGAATLSVVAAGVAAAVWLRPAPASPAGQAACHPSGPPAERPADETRLSRTARVFIRQDTTPDQRNLIEAAIARVWATRAFSFHYDPSAGEYADAYCGGRPLPAGVGATLPYFWLVDVSSPGAVPALAAEVAGMPGVLAVRRG